MAFTHVGGPTPDPTAVGLMDTPIWGYINSATQPQGDVTFALQGPAATDPTPAVRSTTTGNGNSANPTFVNFGTHAAGDVAIVAMTHATFPTAAASPPSAYTPAGWTAI